MSKIEKFLKNESGMTTVEYALLAVGIFLAVFAVVRTLGKSTGDKFSEMAGELKTK